RAIEVGQAEQFCSVVANVGNVQRQVSGNRALNIECPVRDIRSPEVTLDREEIARLRSCRQWRNSWQWSNRRAVAAGGRCVENNARTRPRSGVSACDRFAAESDRTGVYIAAGGTHERAADIEWHTRRHCTEANQVSKGIEFIEAALFVNDAAA